MPKYTTLSILYRDIQYIAIIIELNRIIQSYRGEKKVAIGDFGELVVERFVKN